jgi:hypothetical protein
MVTFTLKRASVVDESAHIGEYLELFSGLLSLEVLSVVGKKLYVKCLLREFPL